jgi:hypothetical protein
MEKKRFTVDCSIFKLEKKAKSWSLKNKVKIKINISQYYDSV